MTKKKTHEERLLELNFEDYRNDLIARGYKTSDTGGSEFELFGVEMTTKLTGLSFDEVQESIVGGEYDGGLDAILVFFNNMLIDSEDKLREVVEERGNEKLANSDSRLHIIFYQIKKGPAFSSDVPSKIEKTLRNYFGDATGLSSVTRSDELDKKLRFVNRTIADLRVQSSQIHFEVRIVSGAEGEPKGEAAQLIKDIGLPLSEEYPGSSYVFRSFGPAELNHWYGFVDDCSAALSTSAENMEVGQQLIFLPRLDEYYDFIVDKEGNLREALFDGNVRAYLGDRIEVNSEILKSLNHRNDENSTPFWWKNNGVTVTCSEVPQKTGARWDLKDVQIVNGLQTSNIIYKYFTQNPDELKALRESANQNDAANRVVVKVIATKSDDQRNQIIQATNSQTEVSKASLRATDQIHRQIEQYFSMSKVTDLVYDRRKGYASSQGIGASRVLQIEELAQAVLSTGLLLPNVAWASPGSAIKDDTRYNNCFGEGRFELDDYLWMASLYKQTSRVARDSFDRADQNLRFYALMVLGILESGFGKDDILTPAASGERQIKKTVRLKFRNHTSFEDELVKDLMDALKGILEQSAKEKGTEKSKFAKGADFRSIIAQRYFDRRSAVYNVLKDKFGDELNKQF